jgi:hypothetical protein
MPISTAANQFVFKQIKWNDYAMSTKQRRAAEQLTPSACPHQAA